MRKTILCIPALENGEIAFFCNPPRQFIRERKTNGREPIPTPA
jgi:hypothetical protein